uniref:Uncharacterized protein n=1 Tax=Zea mays TaxID=4577 RepID=C0PLI8_MAIZE|nr:unknown [Zea mays]
MPTFLLHRPIQSHRTSGSYRPKEARLQDDKATSYHNYYNTNTGRQPN